MILKRTADLTKGFGCVVLTPRDCAVCIPVVRLSINPAGMEAMSRSHYSIATSLYANWTSLLMICRVRFTVACQELIHRICRHRLSASMYQTCHAISVIVAHEVHCILSGCRALFTRDFLGMDRMKNVLRLPYMPSPPSEACVRASLPMSST